MFSSWRSRFRSIAIAAAATAVILVLPGRNIYAIQRMIEIDLVGAGSSGAVLAPGLPRPFSFFLAGARHHFDHTPSVSGYTLSGSFQQVYPGIDMACYTDDHHLEYAFLLATGADPSRIRLRVNGVRFDTLTAEGQIAYQGDGVDVYQHVPAVFHIDENNRKRAAEGRFVLIGDTETSVMMEYPADDDSERLNDTRFHIVPGNAGGIGPGYDFFMSRYEVTNEQLVRFLNDAQINRHNPRGENMFFDDQGNVWINPAMKPDRDELFKIRASGILYGPDRTTGARYHHITNEHGERPFRDHPAAGVSWFGAVKYCNWLTLQSGRGLTQRCYHEGTNVLDWAPVTATNWANGFFSAAERRSWLTLHGFRLPMFRLFDPQHNNDTHIFNEFLKAGSWNGKTNVNYGFGRNTFTINDANVIDASMLLNTDTLPVGFFNGINPYINGRTRFNENAFGIHDLTGNIGEWLNDPARGGVPDARSIAGGSFRDRLRTLSESVIATPWSSDDAGGFRPVTMYMPQSLMQINILFCFHSSHEIHGDIRDRFGIAFAPPGPAPLPAAPVPVTDPDIAEPDAPPTEVIAETDLPGILYREIAQPPAPPPPAPPPTPFPPPPTPPYIPDIPDPDPEPPPDLFILDVLTVNPDSLVAISISNPDYYDRGDGVSAFTRQYRFGDVVTATAPASAAGNVFQYWLRNGEPFTTSRSITVQMFSDLQLTAVYLTPVPPIQRTLTVDSTPGRNVPITVSRADNNNLQDGSTRFTRIYNHNTKVTVTAPASADGESFQGWLLNGVPFSNSRTVTVTLASEISLTAVYGQKPAADQRQLTVTSANPDGDVAMSVSIPDVNGQQDGDTTFHRLYEPGTPVSVTAPSVAPNGNTFDRWLRNGVPFSTNQTIPVVMSTDIILTAMYASPIPDVTLVVRSTNPHSGVNIEMGTPDKNGDADGSTAFNRVYDKGTVTTVTAPPVAPNGNRFDRWIYNGAALSTNTTVTLMLLTDSELTAVYVPPDPPVVYRNLSVRSQNPGSGVFITISVADIHGDRSGQTAFDRTFTRGAEVTLAAPSVAPDGNLFDYWLVDGVRYSSSQVITLTMVTDRAVTAVYKDPPPVVRYILTVESRAPNSGVLVTVSPIDVNEQQNGVTLFTRLYDEGETVTLTARNPAFSGSSNYLQLWLLDDIPISTNATLTVTMLRDTRVTAVYGPPPAPENHTLTVESLNPDGGVSIRISAHDLNGVADGVTTFDRIYSYGTPVTASAPAVAPNGHIFEHWLLNGILFATNTTLSISMLADLTLTAVYAPPPAERTLTVNSRTPNSGVVIQVNQTDNRGNQNGTTAFQRFYGEGQRVTLTAPPLAPNHRDIFLGWERDGIPVTTNRTVDVTLFTDVEMTAVYGPPPLVNLTVKSLNPDRGLPVSISTPDILGRTGGATLFVRTYNLGENVTVTAPAISPTGTEFQEWRRNGIPYSTDREIDITLLTDLELTAVYGPPEPVIRSLIVRSVNPDSNVPIDITPVDTRSLGSGETALQRLYLDGDTVTLTAPSTVGTNTFRQWILNGSPVTYTNLTFSITMLQDHELIAVYGPPVQPQERVLTVDSRNPNSGVPISVSGPDISDATDGSTVFVRIYNYGDTTTLIAPGIAGTNNNTFLRWERDGVPYSEENEVTLDMLADIRMTAVYGDATPNVTLTVKSENPESGVVINVAPGDLNARTSGETTFERIYEYGQTVTLTAPPTADDRPFLYWRYNDDYILATNPVVNVTLLGNLTMTAVYGDPVEPPATVTLIVRSSGPDGAITTLVSATLDNNNNADGSTEFTRIYNTGSQVTLTAPAVSNGLNFDHWEISGSRLSNSQSVTLTLLANTTITAVYVQPPPSVSGL